MLLSGQWRGGSTLAEGIIFTTCKEASSLFLLDEPSFTALALARQHNSVFPDELRPRIAATNAEAIACHLHHFNHSALLPWVGYRANFSGLPSPKFTTYSELLRTCRSRGANRRALKTIRMVGSLSSFIGHPLIRTHPYRVVVLLRHPLATIRSRQSILGPTSSFRADVDPPSVCKLMLQDMLALQRKIGRAHV